MEIIVGVFCREHVHLWVVIPFQLSILNFVRYIKGKGVLMIYWFMTDIRNYKICQKSSK
ncbi:hypothetical protein [Candidatus Merdisoma sp. JLR.KK006]|uniref:hypothetical protein n=1 Tax=Candidatus Merdisoma sp. JLR.KK006 TaxID=3112626 RepID=UPI002FEF03F1